MCNCFEKEALMSEEMLSIKSKEKSGSNDICDMYNLIIFQFNNYIWCKE